MSTTIDEAVARILAARPTFKVGDRVRVTAAIAECRRPVGALSPAMEHGHPTGHPEWQRGLVGTVRQCPAGHPCRHPNGHSVAVQWDRRPSEAWPAIDDHYSATELEPLDAAGAPADEGA